MSNGIEEIGVVQWQVALCLLLAWTLTFLALSKGVKSVGKASSSISLHSCFRYLCGTRNMGVRSVGKISPPLAYTLAFITCVELVIWVSGPLAR